MYPFKTNYPTPADQAAIKKLTALWALSESGLGGIMFALRIPFTGFIIGAIAMIIISLIARISGRNAGTLLGATVVVLIVKATVSPHSPFPAYLAVSFQGLMGALLFSVFPHHRTACILLGMLSMAESAFQKLLIVTLVFGKDLWQAFNTFVTEAAKNAGLTGVHNYAEWFVAVYLFIYLLWGAVVGNWAAGIFNAAHSNKAETLSAFALLPENFSDNSPEAKKPDAERGLYFTWQHYCLL